MTGIVTVVTSCIMFATFVAGQESTRLTPLQREIERQRQRLGSLEIEERRDALMRLANLKRPEASRAAAAALTDDESDCSRRGSPRSHLFAQS